MTTKKLIIFLIMLLCIGSLWSQEFPLEIPSAVTKAIPPPVMGNLRLIWPLGDGTPNNIKITSPYGYRDDVKLPDAGGAEDSIHFAIDMIPKSGDMSKIRVNAAEDGVAVNVYPAPDGRKFRGNRVFGGCVELRHIFAIVNGRIIYAYTFYAHMKEVWVKEGQIVKQGEPLGLMGSTGESTGPHLHFELRLNPIDFLLMSDEMRKASQDLSAQDNIYYAVRREYTNWGKLH
jgi:murein DD-endopeptidase MepM/ murein hydrolase activator NlpD